MTGGSGLSAPRREGTVTGGWPALGERGCCGERTECGPREEENGPRFGLGQGEGKGGSWASRERERADRAGPRSRVGLLLGLGFCWVFFYSYPIQLTQTI